MLRYFLLLVSIYLASAHRHGGRGRPNRTPTVRTTLGEIRGSLMKSLNGVTIYSFRGIPYADHTRFQPPKPITTYKGFLNATEDGPACFFPSDIDEIIMSEDCLRLNVYSAKLPPPRSGHPPSSSARRSPVMVFFHPGGFYGGSGQSILYGPDYFLDHDVVLVTVNYRLASLGFMSTGTKESPGNLGFKDQVESLRWVKKYIEYFGGDPDLVTIFGYSAGSISVGLHMLSPMSRGLFHRAIAMSGGGAGAANWDIPQHQLNLAQKQARLLDCPEDSPAGIVSCLKDKSAREIANTLSGFSEFDIDPILIWTPVVEPDFGQERFLTEHPLETIRRGDIADVPFINGMTELEFSNRAYAVLTNDTLVDELNAKWEQIAPIAIVYERDTERSRMISTELRKSFLNDQPLRNDDASKRNLAILYADGLIGFGVHRFTQLMAEKSPNSVHYYKFSFKGRYSHFYLPGTNQTIGPVHHDDMSYLFYVKLLFPKFTDLDPEILIVRRLTKMWTNFARHGNPTPQQDSLFENQQWPQFKTQTKDYLDIGQGLEVKQCLFCERFQVWDRLFPLR